MRTVLWCPLPVVRARWEALWTRPSADLGQSEIDERDRSLLLHSLYIPYVYLRFLNKYYGWRSVCTAHPDSLLLHLLCLLLHLCAPRCSVLYSSTHPRVGLYRLRRSRGWSWPRRTSRSWPRPHCAPSQLCRAVLLGMTEVLQWKSLWVLTVAAATADARAGGLYGWDQTSWGTYYEGKAFGMGTNTRALCCALEGKNTQVKQGA